jgi:5'-deoxynucleotidase YfbR-like HD superfamily hydrolase
VKELDHLDLLLQAREYEQKGHTDLDEFFRLQFKHPTTSALAEQIMSDHKVLKEKSIANGTKENESTE